ncbi:beta-ketoacyl-[acyl-carrier-protein] synthase family protein [Allostreptomyces psammosilenae]|uniref:3-oxoacyl-[acyl-carrier-protein] synthase 2 n=1 Tax=Allostreptomyces psammosilenae TaxID=1892865 RepID=A0A852ZR38_9ACTN|nr:beta-ketoacyl-[acyl-carrier-protein] synthase family protein [Allostreptomyces psammosilenae]NYI04916.1 3-oxoacyl-[acyl-carrier-protein] synthase II [Allostreptomyces psammosilenae]
MTTGTSAGKIDIAVTGLGLVSAAGIGVEATWQRLLAGEPTAAKDENLAGLPVDFSCRVPEFDADAHFGRALSRRIARFTQIAMIAAREAVADAGLDHTSWDGARVGVVIGNTMGGTEAFESQHVTLMDKGPSRMSPMVIPLICVNMVAGNISIDLGATGPSWVTSTACASGATAIGTAQDLLRSGACDIVIAGGTEAVLVPTIIGGFARMGALSKRVEDPARASRPFDVDRDGFVAGEGAGVLVLERASDARARGARTRALLAGFGASSDAHHPTSPEPEGRGAERAMRAALAAADIAPHEVAHVNAHGTSTPLNDAAESAMVRRVIGEGAAVTSVKGVLGHTLGAAGAIEAVCSVLAVERGEVPPTANLESQDPAVQLDVVTKQPREMKVPVAVSNSFGFGGQNAVLVFTSA